MLVHVMAAELLKYRRSLAPWLMAAGGVFPAFVALLFLLTGGGGVSGERLAFQGLGFLDMLALLLAAVIAGQAFVSEYRGGGVNGLRSYPVPRLLLYGAKLVVLALPVLGMHLVFLAATAAAVLAFAGGASPAPGFGADMLRIGLLSAACCFSLVPLTGIVSMMVKNAGASVLAGVAYFVVYMSAAGSRWARCLPPCAADVALKAYASTGRVLADDARVALAVCAGFFVLTAGIGAAWFSRRDA
jgi:hypothetical protein